mgnify:CR=1 FL=1
MIIEISNLIGIIFIRSPFENPKIKHGYMDLFVGKKCQTKTDNKKTRNDKNFYNNDDH